MRYLHQDGSKADRGKTSGIAPSIWCTVSPFLPQSCIGPRRVSSALLRKALAMFAPGRNHDTVEPHTILAFQNGCRSSHLEFVRMPTRTECTFRPLPLPTALERSGTLLVLAPRPVYRQFGAKFLPSAGFSRMRAVSAHAESNQRLSSGSPLNAWFHIEAVNRLLSILTSRPE